MYSSCPVLERAGWELRWVPSRGDGLSCTIATPCNALSNPQGELRGSGLFSRWLGKALLPLNARCCSVEFCSGLSGYDHHSLQMKPNAGTPRAWHSLPEGVQAALCMPGCEGSDSSSYCVTVVSLLFEVPFLRFHFLGTHVVPLRLHSPFLPLTPSLAHRNPHEKDGFLSPCCLVSIAPVVWFPWGPLWPVLRPVVFLRRLAAHLPLRREARGGLRGQQREQGQGSFHLRPRPHSPCSRAPSCGWEAKHGWELAAQRTSEHPSPA